MRRMIAIVGVVATVLLATVGQAQTIDVSEASGDYSFTILMTMAWRRQGH